ncbi:MAG TPA: helix-turn-helix domain-containing protein [Actinomycetes bacterium]|nr:helix-turn-helix domain-containing protein [Actinomycetes bacterium]
MEERVGSTRGDRVPDDGGLPTGPAEAVVVDPVFVVTQMFPARPSSIPEIREFVLRYLRDAPLSPEGSQQVHSAVLRALLDAASPDGGQIQVCFRIFPDGVEVDVLRGTASAGSSFPAVPRDRPEHRSFAEWLSGVLKREGLSQEAAARQLGVSVKTVSRWVGGETEPRLRELRRIHEVFGEAPLG